MKRFNHILLLSIIFLSVINFQSQLEIVNGQIGLEPTSLAIDGEIKDNFANITYSLVFDNQVSLTDTLLEYQMKAPTGLYLSNVSASMGNETYWGQVYPIQQAQQIFNTSITANKSAVLVTFYNDIYTFEINVKAGVVLYLVAFFEGYVTRQLGVYNFELYTPIYSTPLDFDLNLRIISSFSTVLSSYVDGLVGVFRSSIPGGVQLQFSQTDLILIQKLDTRYSLNVLNNGGKLITHSNGTDNFFAYLFAPEIQNIADREIREYIFIIDVSGSMGGTKLTQAKEAFIAMINTLGSTDLFNVVSFASSSNLMWVESDLATATNKDDAIVWVNGLSAAGATNINAALLDGLGTFSATDTAKAIAFLSDGEPTTGAATEAQNILNNMKQANTNDVPIFSIAFGASTNEGLMASIAFETNGMFTIILPGDEAVAKLELFYENFAVPIALGVTMAYKNATNVYPASNSIKGALFNGTEIISTGLFTGTLRITTSIEYSTGNVPYQNSADAVSVGDNPHVELIWAHNTINKLLKLLLVDPADQNLKDEIVKIAVSYGIVVPNFTALTIVLEEPVVEDGGFTKEVSSIAPPNTGNPNVDVGTVTQVEEFIESAEDSASISLFAIIFALPVMIIGLRKRRVS